MIFQTEKQLKEYGEKIPADKKSPIEAALTELKAAHAARNVSGIDAAMEKINTAWQAASQDMYNATQGAGGDGGNGQANGGNAGGTTGSNDGEVTDVDFEEVKDDKK